jgi:CO/xanthine dehydrogenase Mo-binding subunit
LDGFYADIKTGDNPMSGPTPYFVHYLPDKDPNKNEPGMLVFDDGVISALGTYEKKRLTFLPEEDEKPLPGHYKFSAYQRPLHKGPQTSSGRFEIWGEAAVVVTDEDINICYDNDSNTNVDVRAIPETTQPAALTKDKSESVNSETDQIPAIPVNNGDEESLENEKEPEEIAEEALKEEDPQVEEDAELPEENSNETPETEEETNETTEETK